MSVYLLLEENATCASLNKKSFIWATHSEVFLPLKVVLEENALSFRRIFYFHVSPINFVVTTAIRFFVFWNFPLVMKITIKIPFYERFHRMLFVYKENRGNDCYHAQTNKREETWAGCLQIMVIMSTKWFVQNIFSAWRRMNNLTELPPIDMNYIFTAQQPQYYPPYLKPLTTRYSACYFISFSFNQHLQSWYII